MTVGAERTPGPLCQVEKPLLVTDGTMCLAPSPRPGPLGGPDNGIAGWDVGHKLLEAARRTTAKLPAEMRQQFAALFAPQNLAITAGVLTVWGASHAVGVGEAADLGLLVVGVATIGRQALQAAGDIWDYVKIAATARCDADLDRAADHLARAVVTIGVAAFIALIMKAGARLLGRAAVSARTATAEGEVIAAQAGRGAWWKAWDFGEDWPGTSVPRGFRIEVGGRTFRVTPNATKHMAENASQLPTGGQLAQPGVWTTSPGARMTQVDYPLSSLAGALEQAAQRLQGQPAQRHFFVEGNWELGIDTADSPWAVYHAVPKGQ